MHLKLAKAAARVAAASAVVAASGLGFAQAAMAKPATSGINVPCSADALASAISGNTGGETLSLTKFCVYKLPGALPNITENLTIDGNQTTIERSYASDTSYFSIFYVPDDVSLVLNQVNVRNGDTDDDYGGAIDNADGSVTVNGGTFSDNTSSYAGGAIYNEASLMVSGATFTDNSAPDYGGAIENTDDALVTGSTFTGNSTGGKGGAIYVDGHTAVADSNFTSNSAEHGGGIYAADDGETFAVTGSGFYQNTASGHGGGIDNGDDDMTLTGGGFYQNTAYQGGGIYNYHDMTVDGATFHMNAASDEGGGIYSEYDVALNGDTIQQNSAEWGGGYYNTSHGTVHVTDGQIVSNTATEGGGGIYNDDGYVTLTTTSVINNIPDNCEPVNTISGCTD
jgi:predicted outer membrane repeat protein